MRISDWSSDVCSSDLKMARKGCADASDALDGDTDPLHVQPPQLVANGRLKAQKHAQRGRRTGIAACGAFGHRKARHMVSPARDPPHVLGGPVLTRVV